MKIFAMFLSSSAPDDTIKYDTTASQTVAAIFSKLEHSRKSLQGFRNQS